MKKPILKNHLCFKLYALSRQVTSLYRPFLEELDMTYPQYLVMLILWEQSRLQVKDLGAQLYLDTGTLTPLLKRLERKSMLSRRRDTADERSVIIELTELGKSMQYKAECIPQRLNQAIQLDDKEYESVKFTLDRLLVKIG